MKATIEAKSREIRLAVMRLSQVAGIAHYGPAFSAVEILATLYYGFLSVRPEEPDWPERDRLVLSKGHACSALYPILVDKGVFPASELERFTRLGSPLGDHPDMRKVPGVDFSSGSLGHGLSVAVGMAEGLRLRGIDSRVVVIVGDGEQNEGQVWEAVQYAGFRKLANLMVICDRNKVQVDGRTEDIMGVEPMSERWAAFGWNTIDVDGHDIDALREAYSRFDATRRKPGAGPTFINADTVSGKGVPFIEDDADWHLGYLEGVDYQRAMAALNADEVEARI